MTEDSLVAVIAEAVAEHQDRDVLDLPPIYESIDAEALESFYESVDSELLVSFVHDGVRVIVRKDTELAVYTEESNHPTR